MAVNLLTDRGILAVAKKRWPEVGKRTSIIPTGAKKLTVPVMERDDRPIMERWVGRREGLMLGQATIELEPVEDVPGIVAMGYNAEADVLAVTLTRQ